MQAEQGAASAHTIGCSSNFEVVLDSEYLQECGCLLLMVQGQEAMCSSTHLSKTSGVFCKDFDVGDSNHSCPQIMPLRPVIVPRYGGKFLSGDGGR